MLGTLGSPAGAGRLCWRRAGQPGRRYAFPFLSFSWNGCLQVFLRGAASAHQRCARFQDPLGAVLSWMLG